MRAGMAVVVVLMGLAGCVSPYQLPGAADEFLVADHTEVRSPFGTNGGYDVLKRCKGPSRPVLFYMQADFTECQVLAVGGEIAQHKSSQGQGGQIVSGLMNAAALGGVAAAAGNAGSAVSNASSTAITNVTVRGGYGHR